MQLFLGIIALVASTTFAVRRQFVDYKGRVAGRGILRRPSSLESPDEQLDLLLELRTEQLRQQQDRTDAEEDATLEDVESKLSNIEALIMKRMAARRAAKVGAGISGKGSGRSILGASNTESTEGGATNSLSARLFSPAGKGGGALGATLTADGTNSSDEEGEGDGSSGVSRADAELLREKLKRGASALGAGAVGATWVNGTNGTNGTAFVAPPPIWFKCPAWNGTAEQRLERCRNNPNRDPNGYVHLISTREGMSAWTHILWEMLRFAKTLNRTFVEPCVAGGEIIPCTPGRVHMVPESLRKTGRYGPVTARRDPLRVKAFLGACGLNGRGKGVEKRLGRSYPLRLYLDLRHLRQYYRKIISFEEWAQSELCDCPDDELKWDGRTLTGELGYCVAWGPRAAQIKSSWCSPEQGPYRFGAVWAPRVMPDHMPHWVRDGRFQGHMFYYLDELRNDPRRNMFFWNVWRGSFEPLGSHKKPPRFNEIHQAAVDAWLGDRLGLAASQYAAFQWRAEQVEESEIFGCATEMARISRPIIDAIRGPELNGGVLVADIPAPNNPCMMWKEFHASNRNSSEHRRAVKRLLSVGMVKYDKDHPALDAGVLSIRDWLIATRATYYVTCSGTNDKCRSCFRAESKFIGRIIEARRQGKLSSYTRWFDLTPKALFSMGAGPPKPYNVTPAEGGLLGEGGLGGVGGLDGADPGVGGGLGAGGLPPPGGGVGGLAGGAVPGAGGGKVAPNLPVL